MDELLYLSKGISNVLSADAQKLKELKSEYSIG